MCSYHHALHQVDIKCNTSLVGKIGQFYFTQRGLDLSPKYPILKVSLFQSMFRCLVKHTAVREEHTACLSYI